MVQAAGSGMIDFRAADVLDRKWQIKLHWILDYISSTHCIKIYEHKLQQRLAVLQILKDPMQIDACWKTIGKLRNKVINEMVPWVATGDKSLLEVAKSLRDKYVQLFPDPSSPEGIAEIERLKAFWRGENNESG